MQAEQPAAEHQRVRGAHVALDGLDKRKALAHLFARHGVTGLVLGDVDRRHVLRHRCAPLVGGQNATSLARRTAVADSTNRTHLDLPTSVDRFELDHHGGSSGKRSRPPVKGQSGWDAEKMNGRTYPLRSINRLQPKVASHTPAGGRNQMPWSKHEPRGRFSARGEDSSGEPGADPPAAATAPAGEQTK
jgi:hypothetical protein